MFPYKSPGILRRLYPSLVWEKPNQDREVFLTFDDGPTPEITDWVLECLDQYEQQATFFCIGDNVLKHPAIYDRVQQRGHAVGNHTQRHTNGFKASVEKYVNDVEQCAGLVSSNLFRPPYGRIKRSQIRALEDKFTIVEWSIISRDYYPRLNLASSINALKKHTRPGSIVVFHDSQKAFNNLKVLLPAYLDFLEANGYRSSAL